MARTHGTSVAAPERRYAAKFSAKYGLTPPVDIEAVLSTFADIERDRLPGTADAILLRTERKRPRILISDRLNRNRFRFTLAHELGHIVLPWQVGSAFCHPNVTVVTSTGLHQEVEAQANKFATELLIPMDWALARIGTSPDDLAGRIVAIANDAGVSPITASITLGSSFPYPAGTCVLDENGKKLYSTCTEDFPVAKDSTWWVGARLSELDAAATSVMFGGYTLHTIAFRDPEVYPVNRPKDDSRTILQEIMQSVPTSQRAALANSVNGVIGYGNSKAEAEASAGDLVAVLRRRFFQRESLMAVTGHPRFDEFLRAKACELFDRRQAAAPDSQK